MPELQPVPQAPLPAAEWALRVELAAAYRIGRGVFVALRRLVDTRDTSYQS